MGSEIKASPNNSSAQLQEAAQRAIQQAGAKVAEKVAESSRAHDQAPLSQPDVQSGAKTPDAAAKAGIPKGGQGAVQNAGVVSDSQEVSEFKGLAAKKFNAVVASVPPQERAGVQQAFEKFHEQPNAKTLSTFIRVADGAMAKTKTDPAAAHKMAHGQAKNLANHPELSSSQRSGVQQMIAHTEGRQARGEITQGDATKVLQSLVNQGTLAIKRERARTEDVAASHNLADLERAYETAKQSGNPTDIERSSQDVAAAQAKSEATVAHRASIEKEAEGAGLPRKPWVPFGE